MKIRRLIRVIIFSPMICGFVTAVYLVGLIDYALCGEYTRFADIYKQLKLHINS